MEIGVFLSNSIQQWEKPRNGPVWANNSAGQINMATKEAIKVGKPEDIQERAMTMALAILVERIRSLPKDDKDDLYELMKEIPGAETDEDLEEIATGMLEILDQAQVTVTRIDQDGTPSPGYQRWLDYVSDKIRTLRIKAEMTQTELAEKSGLPQSHISRLEAGKHSPSRATLERIAKALKIPLSDIDPSA